MFIHVVCGWLQHFFGHKIFVGTFQKFLKWKKYRSLLLLQPTEGSILCGSLIKFLVKFIKQRRQRQRYWEQICDLVTQLTFPDIDIESDLDSIHISSDVLATRKYVWIWESNARDWRWSEGGAQPLSALKLLSDRLGVGGDIGVQKRNFFCHAENAFENMNNMHWLLEFDWRLARQFKWRGGRFFQNLY